MRLWEDVEIPVREAEERPGVYTAGSGLDMSRREAAELTRSALAAGLAVGCAFIFGFFLFILFATKVWFN